MRSLGLIIFGLCTGCAGAPSGAARGALALEIEAVTPIDYVEFVRRGTEETARLVALPTGRSAQRLRVRSGQWCLTEVGVGGPDRHVMRPEESLCASIRWNETVNLGGLGVEVDHLSYYRTGTESRTVAAR